MSIALHTPVRKKRENSALILNKKFFYDLIDDKDTIGKWRQNLKSDEVVDIKQELAKRERINNDALVLNNTLKKISLIVLFIFLTFETIVIFWYTFLQATFSLGFYLEEWSFKLLVFATISQITFMVQIAITHLFPKDKLHN